MHRLHSLLGQEHEMADVCRTLRTYVHGLGAPIVGAFHITCADESEHECSDHFQRAFAQACLPRLKYGSRVPFRIANPGARYEWGCVRIAEDHFATPETEQAYKVLLVKVNGHVSVEHGGSETRFGKMRRYGAKSTYCGAVNALLKGVDLPFVNDLHDAFLSDGRDRLAVLQDAAQVDPALRMLYGSIVNARLQARRVVQDIQDYTPKTPTIYLVLHGITLNKPGPDTELLGGLYVLDHRSGTRQDRYRGLGDDPAGYRMEERDGKLHVEDDAISKERDARDHRRVARERLRKLTHAAHVDPARVRGLLAKASEGRSGRTAVAAALLKPLLAGLATASPVATALLLLAEGVAAIHHVQHLHRASPDDELQAQARRVLASVEKDLAAMPADEAARVLDVLIEAFGKATHA